MHCLKISFLLFLFGSLISSCQSTTDFRLETFSAGDQVNELHIIHTNSDRVRQECLFMNAEGDNNWRHQYFMYVLSDKDEVLEIMESTHTDGDSCRSQYRAIETILEEESRTRICVHDRLSKSQGSEAQIHSISFGPLGRYKVMQVGLSFDTICNSKRCVGDNSAWVSTCPGFIKH